MAKVTVPSLGKEGEGSKVAVANEVPSCSGVCCWGTEKGRALRVLPSLLELPKIGVKRGWGPERLCHPRRQSHPLPKTVPPASWCVVRDVGHTSLPGLRDCRRSRLRTPGKTKTGRGNKTRKSSPTWHQNRASSKKQNLDLYSRYSWPAPSRGLTH